MTRVASILAVLLLLAGCASIHRDHVTKAEPSGGAAEIPPEDRWTGVKHDPPSGPSESAAGTNVRVNQDASGYDQNETVITVDPNDPLSLIGGANDYRTGNVKCGYYASVDGGLTWTDGVLPEEKYPRQGDPTVAFCGDGSAVYVCLSFTGSFQPHGLFSYITEDAGQTWSGPHTILDRPNGYPFADKEWVACDTTSGPTANNVYTTWTEFNFSSTPIYMKRSTDGGRKWGPQVQVSDGGSTQGSVIAVGPDGAVNVAWSDAGGSRIGFDRSTDRGRSFGTDVFPSFVNGIPGDPVFRRNSFPVMDVDRSDGQHSGSIYIAWADDRHGDPDILLVRSEDDGVTWSEPVRINDDPVDNGADQWFPWLAVDPLGRVIVTFHDRRMFPSDRPYQIWGAISRDGGRTFDTNFIISDSTSDGALNDFIGDYSGLAATAETLHPLWCDLRPGTGESDIYSDSYPNRYAYDEVKGLIWLDSDSLEFQSQDDRFGVDLDYDVVSGLLTELRGDLGFDRAECGSAAWSAPPYVDNRIPPVGDGYYFLIRCHGPDGTGTYGYAYPPSRIDERQPLDTEPGVCP